MNDPQGAHEEKSVASLYKNADVAQRYIEHRFSFTWNKLLHESQVAAINRVIREYQPGVIVEFAPGPARLATDLEGVRKGLMVEYSEEMLVEARQRLELAGCASAWEVQHGNAFDFDGRHLQAGLLYTFRFIRHFKAEDRTRLYRTINACLKPQGLLMFDVVNRPIRQKLDAKMSQKPQGELEVYDAIYSAKEFCQEIRAHGFDIVSLTPVLRHFELQSWMSYAFDHRMKKVADLMIRLLEKFPSPNPLEWIALCRKTDE